MKKIRNDILLVLALLILAFGAWAVYHFTGKPGKTVTVLSDGKTVLTLDLDKDCEQMLSYQDLGTNILVIKDGKAFIRQADCPDGICVAHAPISAEGESIICLPHRLVVKVGA